MPNGKTDPPRLAWLDGLRGIAATQVVLLHYVSAFLPAIGLRDGKLIHNNWESSFIHTPLFLPFDGYSAVYIFFVLSGVALTYSFSATPYAIPSGVVRRIIRLGIPMAAGILLGAAWFSLWPDIHIAASRLSGSPWLAMLGPDRVTAAAIAHQIGFEGLLSGYAEISILPPIIRGLLGLQSLLKSVNPPLWTLHIEFVGSLMILGLVALRHTVRRRTHLIICLLLTGSLLTSMLFLFVIGHMAADWLRTPSDRRTNLILGAGLLSLGIWLCTSEPIASLHRLTSHFPVPFVGRQEEPEMVQSMYGAVATFLGLAYLPRLQHILIRPTCQWLGKISFSLYLTHFPIVITAASAAFCLLAIKLPYLVAVLVVTVMGCLLSFLIAPVFEWAVDRQAIRLSRIAFRTLRKNQPARPASERKPDTEDTIPPPAAFFRRPD